MDVYFNLLKCLLGKVRPESTNEEALRSCTVSSSSFDRCDYHNSVHVYWNESTASSQKSLSASPATSADVSFTRKNSSPESLLSASRLEEGSPDRDLKNAKLLKDIQSTTTGVKKEERSSLINDHQGGTSHDTHTSVTEFVAVNNSNLPLSKWNKQWLVNQNQGQCNSAKPYQSIPRLPSAASSENMDKGTVPDVFRLPIQSNTENELAACRKRCVELEQQMRKLDEQLKQSEEEKRQLQADLGRYLFLEEREKCSERLLVSAASVQDLGQ